MISLVEITFANWEECIALSVSEEQRKFVAPNVYSLAQSKYEPYMIPLGISDGSRLVGFSMHVKDADAEKAWIVRFMIDKEHQRKGYGKEALMALLVLMSEKYPKSDVFLCVEPDNDVAKKFYESFGFTPTGEVWGRELIYCLKKGSAADARRNF